MSIRSRTWVTTVLLWSAAALAACGSDGTADNGEGASGTGGSSWGMGGAQTGTGNAPPPPVTCGNNTIDPGEACDGVNLAGQSCASTSMNAQPNGTLRCAFNCQFDTSQCFGNTGSGGSGTGTGGFSNTGGGLSSGGSANPGAGGAIGAGGATLPGDAPTSASASRAGPFQVATYTSGYRDGPAYNDSTIHYPSNGTPPHAAIAVVPGWQSPQSSIQAWGPFLASHGIVTMTIGTNLPGDDPTVRSRALLDALETIRTENVRGGGQLNGKLDLSRLGIMGWSMGGGGTLIAANVTPTLKAAISLCGWNPGGTYPTNQVPSLMFASTNDLLAGGQSQGFYNSIPASTPKMLFEMDPGGHAVANDPAYENGRVGRYGLSWLKVFLEGDERYRQFLLERPTGTIADFMSNL